MNTLLESLGAMGFADRRAPSAAAAPVTTRDKGEERFSEWAAEHPDEAAWILASAKSGFSFAMDLKAAVKKYGGLTENQAAAVRRLIQQAKEREQRRAAMNASREAAPAITVARIEEAFGVAKESGIKVPKLRLDAFTFKPAPATGANAGAIYVTEAQRGGAYLGKVLGGKFLRSQVCSDEAEKAIVAAASDPHAAAIAYGQRTGTCSACGMPLSNAESIELGIGPICRERFGWA